MSAAARETLDYLEQHASATVTVSALHGGTFTLPLKVFLASATDKDRSTVPSLSFLVVHPRGGTTDDNKETRKLVFDLGLRRETDQYIAPIRQHLTTRQPLDASRDVRRSLLDGGVPPAAIADVIVSHVHWDHTGTPADYPQARFWVGRGALGVLAHGLGGHLGHQHFERDLFLGLDIREFPSPEEEDRGWKKVGTLSLYDFFGDGSAYVVDAPGHLPGHVNLLARLAPRRWVWLAGDACHDRRLLTGADAIAEWQDGAGRSCCIHTDKRQAEATLARIRDLQQAAQDLQIDGSVGGGFSLEVILAHARDWAEANPGAFLPGTIQ